MTKKSTEQLETELEEAQQSAEHDRALLGDLHSIKVALTSDIAEAKHAINRTNPLTTPATVQGLAEKLSNALGKFRQNEAEEKAAREGLENANRRSAHIRRQLIKRDPSKILITVNIVRSIKQAVAEQEGERGLEVRVGEKIGLEGSTEDRQTFNVLVFGTNDYDLYQTVPVDDLIGEGIDWVEDEGVELDLYIYDDMGLRGNLRHFLAAEGDEISITVLPR